MNKLLEQIQDNFLFLLITIAIAAIIIIIAKIAERYLPSRRKVSPARRITIVAVCGAIATILHVLDFPLPFLAPGFYKLDFSEIPVLLCGFFLGPTASVVCEIVKIILKLLLKGTSTVFVGDFANFVIGCHMVLPAVIIYHVHKTRRSAIAGLAAGSIIMTVFGSAFNAVYLLPKFAQLYGTSLEAIVGMGSKINASVTSVISLVAICVVPLNLIKGIAVSVLTMILYKHVARPLFGKMA